MFEEENSQTNTEGKGYLMEAPCYEIREEVRVMLVDHDKEFHNEMIDLLKSYSCKVMTVDMASVAMSMLAEGKEKIDVMIININSPDLLSFQLLAQGLSLNIISLFVCDEDDEVLAKKALDQGAYLYLKKPLHEDIVKYLWQFVLREKTQKEKAEEGVEENGDEINVSGASDIYNTDIVGENNIPLNTEEMSNNIQVTDVESQSNDNKTGKKICIEWTTDLHAKFMEAVHQLGEGRCYPVQILKVMNVPGITRLQVASHLQKCRKNCWRASKERKSIRHPLGQGSSSCGSQQSSRKKLGTMPRLPINVSNLQQHQNDQDQTQGTPEFQFSQLTTNKIFARGESSTLQQLHYPQLQVQPHYFSIDNPFNNPFLSTQNNVVGGLQQQHGPLFGMLNSQGLQDLIIENNNYKPELTFNSGDHHTQNDYNLNLNVDHVTTYSGNSIMFGTDVEYEIMDCRSQNLKPPSANQPNEHESGFDHVYFDDQVTSTSSGQFPGITKFSEDS